MCVVVGAALFAVFAILASIVGPAALGLDASISDGPASHGSVEMAIFLWMDRHPIITILLASILVASLVTVGGCSVVCVLRALRRRQLRPQNRAVLPS
jgi:hypothetical protein